MRDKFFDFLNDNKAYFNYLNGLKSRVGMYNHTFDSFVHRVVADRRQSPAHLISGAFNWCNSKEGTSYWAQLDAKWKALLSLPKSVI